MIPENADCSEAVCVFLIHSKQKNDPSCDGSLMEVPAGVGPALTELQSVALPLG